MAIEDDPYWVARMNMSAKDHAAMRALAEQRARAIYDTATRAIGATENGARAWFTDAANAVDKFKVGVQTQMDRLFQDAGNALRATPTAQAAGATKALQSNYDAMRTANWKGDDKYFHCKGNCEASQLGPVGDWTATHLANAREVYGQHVKHDPRWDELEDQSANRFGRAQGRIDAAGQCNALCAQFRPHGLPTKY